MRFTRSAVLGTTTGLVAVLLAIPPASAQEVRPTMEVDPTSGSVGTRISAAGAGCSGNGAQGVVDLAIAAPAPAPPEDYEAAVTFGDTVVSSDGTWTGTLVVPSTYTVPDGQGSTREVDVVPGDGYRVIATCRLGSGGLTQYIQYEDVPFEVIEGSDALLPISVEPTRGPVGTSVRVSGSDCPGGQLYAWIFAGTGLADATGIVDEAYIEADETGAWSGALIVYETALLFPFFNGEADVVPGDDYSVEAICFLQHERDDGATVTARVLYETVPFEVTAGGSAPPRDGVPTSPIVQPQAAPATPVAGDPGYAG